MHLGPKKKSTRQVETMDANFISDLALKAFQCRISLVEAW
jgi:hypothetical protein